MMRPMKYTVSIELALPREKVAQLLADPAHLPKWLRGLVLHEPLSGEHGQLGTKSRVVMQMGQRKYRVHRDHHTPGTGRPARDPENERRSLRPRDRRRGHVERRA